MKLNNYKLNEQRIKEHFAWYPIIIQGEIRWLEKVKYLEEWYAPNNCWGWYKIKFLN